MFLAGCFGSLLLAATATAEPRYYTPDRVATGRENVARFDWGKEALRRIRQGDTDDYYIGREYAPADLYAKQSDEFLWLLQPTTKIPRVFPIATAAVCPVHGLKVRERNAWHPWKIDPIGHPYQLQCPIGGEWYPSNRYDQGDLTSGPYADDGGGFVVDGKRYYFLRDYAHRVYGNTVIPLLRSFSQAWLLTGDPVYAHKGCLLLARLASEYPNYEDRADRQYMAPMGGHHVDYPWKSGGMVTDLIWETFCLEATAYAYDALAPCYGQNPELLAMLKAKGLPITDGESARRYVRQSLFRPAAQALLKGDIKGNEGFHQAAALAVALVLDDFGEQHPNSQDLVDYAYHGAGHSAWMLVNGVLPDGGGHESLGYNSIKLDFIRVARLMEQLRRRHPERFPLDRYPDLFGNPKSMAIFDWFIDYLLLDHFSLEIGDAGGPLVPVKGGHDHWSFLDRQNLYAFERTGNPRYARACTRHDGGLVSGELWEPYPAEAITAALQRPESVIRREPRLLDSYGLAVLESGEGSDARAVALNYSALIGHRQADNLFCGLFAHGVSYLPDLGYPFTWQYRTQWDANSLAHNTVTVDETQPAADIGGACRLFASAGGVHVMTCSHDPYPAADTARPAAKGVDVYERTMVLVDVSPTVFYAVDLFTVRGGEQHDQSWHGPLIEPKAPELSWESLPGTLAGPEVPQFGTWQDRWGRQRDDFPSYLTGLRRATLTAPAAWEWPFGLPTGEGLRLHLVPVGGPLTVFAGRGRSPARPVDWAMPYLIVRRTGAAGLASRFVTVLDPYQGQPVVQAVSVVSEQPLRLEVQRAGGTDTLTFDLPDQPSRDPAPRPVGVTVERGGQTVRIGGAGGYVHGRIVAVDYAAKRVALADEPAFAEAAAGRFVRVFNTERTTMQRVEAVERPDGRLWLTLHDTPLLAQAPVVDARDGRLTLGAFLLFGNGRVDAAGKLAPGVQSFGGSALGEGAAARRVAGVVRGEQSLVVLAEPVPAAELKRDWLGRTVSLWQYGPGDTVELARVTGR